MFLPGRTTNSIHSRNKIDMSNGIQFQISFIIETTFILLVMESLALQTNFYLNNSRRTLKLSVNFYINIMSNEQRRRGSWQLSFCGQFSKSYHDKFMHMYENVSLREISFSSCFSFLKSGRDMWNHEENIYTNM